MSGKQLPPENDREVSRLKQRVSALEKQLGNAVGYGRDHGLPFTLSGALFVSESPPWTPRHGTRIVEVVALLGGAGTTPTTIQVRKNGTTIGGGFSFAAGETVKRFTTSSAIAADQDRVTVAVTAAGTGARDLDVIVRFR